MTTQILTRTVAGALALWSSVVFAQTGSTSGSSSSGAATQVQATRPQSFSSNASSSTSGTSGTTGSSTQARGTTQNRMNSANQPQFNAGDGSVGSRIGQNAFVGQGSEAFIGARDASQSMNSAFTSQFSPIRDPSTSQRRANSSSTSVKRARPQQQIAFDYPKANLVRTQVEMSLRFKRLKTVSGADTVISDAGIATLTGIVSDENARKLAEALARLEPGVRSVDNQLQVGPVLP